MKSPSGASAISHDWVEFVVLHHEAKSDPRVAVKLISFSVVMATKPGESFNAELVRVDASAEVRRGDCEEDSSCLKKDYSFVAKFLSVDPFNRELVKAAGYHVRELVMYSKLVGELNSYWETNASCLDVDQRIHVPEYIYGVCSSSEYVLLLENCKESKFETNDKHKGLDLTQTLLAVEQAARLHALSRSYNLTTDICKKYPCFAFNAVVSSFNKAIVVVGLENAIKYVRTLPEHKDILAKLEKGRRTISQKFQCMWEDQSRHQMLCLTHGDFWNSNLLFRYHPVVEGCEQKVEAIKVIDWQIAQWNNPIFDLHYLLNTSTTQKMRDDHLDDILHHYHSTFVRISENVKTPVPDWNYDQFCAEFGRTSLVGFLMGLCVIQGTLSKAGEKLNPNASSSSSSRSGRSVINKLKTVAAKVIVPVAVKPSSQFIIKQAMKKMLAPIAQELIDGKNTIMNERFLGLIFEAERKGLLDVLSM